MLKPIAAIRRKASSFREQRQSKLKNNNSETKTQKRPPSIELDSYFSIDSFLARIKPNRKQQQSQKSTQISVSTTSTSTITSSSTTSSTTTNCLLDELPEKCLQQIFNYLDSKDLQNLRLSCSRFDSIISSSNLIQRKSINLLQLNGNSRDKIYRFSHSNAPIYDRYGFYQSEIDNGLKFLMAKKIIFDNVFIDASVSKALINGINYCLDEIIFDFCHFQLSANAFSQLIQNWKPKRISIINCDWRETANTALICDSLFANYSNLEKFIFSTVGSKKILITDEMFYHFSTSCCLPEVLEFIGCETKITIKGIKNAVTAYFIACKQALINPSNKSKSKSVFKWNFGQIFSSSAETLSILSPFLNHSKIIPTEYPNFEIRFRPSKSFPLLCLSFIFLQQQPKTFYSSRSSDISWDDSDDE
uniref:F-box domain-containing protein n=1 Tax=Panagrolaimus sp. PS1159 TaxID=55785 RepID=A0AC35FFX4_9BILA